MKLELSLVPPGGLTYWLFGLLDYMQKSEAWTRGRAGIDDIMRFLYTGQMNLWVVYDVEEREPYGFVITETKQYPRCRMLVVQYCAGEPNHMKFVEDQMFDTLERFAKDAGCAGIEFFGRPGWTPHAKQHGFDVRTIVYEKHFNEVQP